MRILFKASICALFLGLFAHPSPIAAQDNDPITEMVGQASTSLARGMLEENGVPAPVLDIFFGGNDEVQPIDYAKIASIVADELDNHDFKLAMGKHKQTLERTKTDLENFKRNWNGNSPSERRDQNKILLELYDRLGAITDDVLGNYPKKGFPLFAAVSTLRLGIISMGAQEFDPSSTFTYFQLQEESTRLLTALVERNLMDYKDINRCNKLADVDPNAERYCPRLAHKLWIEWRKIALTAAAKQRIASTAGGSPLKTFSLRNKTGQEIIVKQHSRMGPAIWVNAEKPRVNEFNRFKSLEFARDDEKMLYYQSDPVVMGEAWHVAISGNGQRHIDYYQKDRKNYPGGDWGDIKYVGPDVMIGRYSYPYPRANYLTGEHNYVAAIKSGETWTLPAKPNITLTSQNVNGQLVTKYYNGEPFTTNTWFGIYVQPETKRGVNCLAQASAKWLSRSLIKSNGQRATQEDWGDPNSWDGGWDHRSYVDINFAWDIPPSFAADTDGFGCNARLVANFQAYDGQELILNSLEPKRIAKRASFWIKDPVGTRFTIGDDENYIKHNGAYAVKLTHAQCQAKCAANAKCVMIRVDTKLDAKGEADCLMGSAVGPQSNSSIDEGITSMRLIRGGNWVFNANN